MQEIIRVLHVLGGMDRGGAETMVMNLYRNIDRTKIQFDFIVHTANQCAYDDEINSLGGTIYRVPRYKGTNHLQYKKVWYKFFKEHPEYKLIHGHVRSTASIYLKIAKKAGLMTIAHSHSTSSGRGFSAFVKNILQYQIRDVADFFFACSKSSGEWLFGKQICKNKNFIVLKNAIDANKFIYNENIRSEKRKEFNMQDKFVIGHVGRFHRPKNHEFLIDIFNAVRIKNDKAILMLVGDGELKPSIAGKINALGLNDSVILTGVRSDIPELLQAMDVFVFPSLYEGLPVTLVEAQAAGLPCVVSDTVTDEVKITDLITYVSLQKPAEQWAEEIFCYLKNFKRKDKSQHIFNAGYDIRFTVNYLQEFYINNLSSFNKFRN